MGDDLAPRTTAPGLEPGHGLPPGAVILEQDFDFGSLYALRSAVSAHASEIGMSASRLYDVVTTAHELAANAVRHGAGQGHLRLWLLDGILHCEVSDAGRPAPDDTAPDVPAEAGPNGGGPAGWRSEHGHGLWVVGQIADQFTVDRGNGTGTTATATFALGVVPD
jgi:anti-sigma regulatory factor (Ser/Thr protein kinase)